jgi:heterodisulfide reductase subunit A-like polyferredoxin
MVIAAVSQSVAAEAGGDLTMTRWGTIEIDPQTCATNVAGVYAGGDCARGPSSVIQSVADGKRAAVSIDRQLSGDSALLVYDAEKTEADKDMVLQRTASRARQWRPKGTVPTFVRENGDCPHSSLSREQAVAEAKRCLACGCGVGCETCSQICKMFAWSIDAQGRAVLDEDKCVACGMCVWRCPSKNVEMIQTGTKNLVK